MKLSIDELLFLASSVIVLPVIAVLVASFFTGGLKNTEDAKLVVTAEPEEDYWAVSSPIVAGRRPASPSRPGIAGIPRGGEQG
jgi:hypothetical protein